MVYIFLLYALSSCAYVKCENELFSGGESTMVFRPFAYSNHASSPTPSLSVISTGAPIFFCYTGASRPVPTARSVFTELCTLALWFQLPSRAAAAVCAKRAVYTRPRG